MFTGLKNKIKEETGGDVSKIVSLVNTGGARITSKGRHSRQGSTTSLGSFTIDGYKEESAPVLDIKLQDGRAITPKEFKKLESKEDEWRRKLHKKDEEHTSQLNKVEDSWKKRLEEKEREHQMKLEKKNNENSALLSEIRELQKTVANLQEKAKQSLEYKTKLCQYQDDLDQLEGFQTQEIAKIKHLLLQKEQQLLEKDHVISQHEKKMSELNAEVRRLLEAERKLSDAQDHLEELRHECEQEKAMLTTRLAAEEEASRHLKDRLAVVEERYRAGCMALGGELTPDDRVQGLLGERALLERLLAEAHEHLSEVKTTWSSKITSLETQVGRLCRQASEESTERREAERERDTLAAKLRNLEVEERIMVEKIKKLETEDMRKMERLKVTEERVAELEKENSVLLNQQQSSMSINENALATEAELEERKKTLVVLESRNNQLSEELKTEKEARGRLQEEVSELRVKFESGRTYTEKLKGEVSELRAECESGRTFVEQLQRDVVRERRERDDLMMRNAEVSQEVEFVRQELRRVQQEANDLRTKIADMQATLHSKDQALTKEVIEKETLSRRIEDLEVLNSNKDDEIIKETNNELEIQLQEKNKTIKMLQQRINDMKKTMQRELKVSRTIDPGGGGVNGGGCITPHSPAVLTPSNAEDAFEDVNFKYLKHVLFKFLTCRGYEAQHLTRAVATLLRFTAEEERLLRETMDWRSSWFGSRPKIGSSPRSQAPS